MEIELKESGNQRLKEDDYKGAADMYSKAISLMRAKPHSKRDETLWIALHNNLAQARLKMQWFDSAYECSEEVLSVQPMNHKALYRAALAKMGKMNFSDASLLADKLATVAPLAAAELHRNIHREQHHVSTPLCNVPKTSHDFDTMVQLLCQPSVQMFAYAWFELINHAWDKVYCDMSLEIPQASEIIRRLPEDSELRLKHLGFSLDLSNAVDQLAASNARSPRPPHRMNFLCERLSFGLLFSAHLFDGKLRNGEELLMAVLLLNRYDNRAFKQLGTSMFSVACGKLTASGLTSSGYRGMDLRTFFERELTHENSVIYHITLHDADALGVKSGTSLHFNHVFAILRSAQSCILLQGFAKQYSLAEWMDSEKSLPARAGEEACHGKCDARFRGRLTPERLLELCDTLADLVGQCPFTIDERIAGVLAGITGVYLHGAVSNRLCVSACQVVVSSAQVSLDWASSLARRPATLDPNGVSNLRRNIPLS